jgi:hypothetical protein
MGMIQMLVFVLTLAVVASSQSPSVDAVGSGWVVQSNASLMTTLNAYSDNWEGGEAGAFSWIAQFDGKAEKAITSRVLVSNVAKLAFGQTKSQDEATKKWSIPKKSTDIIDLESVVRFTIGSFADPFAGVRITSLFLDGREASYTRYMNPVTISESFGAAKNIVKTNNVGFSTRFAAAVRQNIDRDQFSPVDSIRETKVSNDAGAEFTSECKLANTAGWASLNSRLKMYAAFINSGDTDSDKDYWKHPDVDWENVLSLNIMKYLMTSIVFHVKYDREKDASVSLKSSSAIGLSFTYKR